MMVLPVLSEVNSVKGPPQGQWTYADWETLPDDGNVYEVIEGVLYMSTSPSYFHRRTRLGILRPGACWRIHARC